MLNQIYKYEQKKTFPAHFGYVVSTLKKKTTAKRKIGRKLAELILEEEATLYSQWFKGEENLLANSLSRDAILINEEVHRYFLNCVAPLQLPRCAAGCGR